MTTVYFLIKFIFVFIQLSNMFLLGTDVIVLQYLKCYSTFKIKNDVVELNLTFHRTP